MRAWDCRSANTPSGSIYTVVQDGRVVAPIALPASAAQQAEILAAITVLAHSGERKAIVVRFALIDVFICCLRGCSGILAGRRPHSAPLGQRLLAAAGASHVQVITSTVITAADAIGHGRFSRPRDA